MSIIAAMMALWIAALVACCGCRPRLRTMVGLAALAVLTEVYQRQSAAEVDDDEEYYWREV